MTELAITKDAYPNLHLAMRAIEEDNGGHLIGTVYPGEPIDLDTFKVPAPWSRLVVPAEEALARLRADMPEYFVEFCTGDFDDIEATISARPDLSVAQKLLNDWFMDWPPEETAR